MKNNVSPIMLFFLLIFTGCLSRTDYVPKPRGYFRIELPGFQYVKLPLDDLPYSFNISTLATIELPPVNQPAAWINISYSLPDAKIYCSYLTIVPDSLDVVMSESKSLVARQSRNAQSIIEQTYDNENERVFATLYQLDGDSPSPVQFMITDSAKNFFRGALFYNNIPNADSLAPVTQFMKADIIELIQSFTWNK